MLTNIHMVTFLLQSQYQSPRLFYTPFLGGGVGEAYVAKLIWPSYCIRPQLNNSSYDNM